MDQVVNEPSLSDEQLQQIISALQIGFIFVDSGGCILWIDERTRQLLNGELQHINLPISRHRAAAVDCFLSPITVSINGEQRPLCILQMTSGQNGQDALAALEAAMSDGSWLTSVLIERLRACLQAKRLTPETSDLDALTARERQILGLICEGRSDTEMSDILHLSQNTVRNHVASLYRKIGVNRRGAAIIWARERAITSKEVLSARVREPSQHGGARK